MNGSARSDFLFATPSFLEGLARILDLGGTLEEYNDALSPEEADFLATRSDWRVVGQDIVAAAQEFEQQLRQQR